MALYASHALIPRGRRPCALREVLRTETARSRQFPVRKHLAEQERPKAVDIERFFVDGIQKDPMQRWIERHS